MLESAMKMKKFHFTNAFNVHVRLFIQIQFQIQNPNQFMKLMSKFCLNGKNVFQFKIIS